MWSVPTKLYLPPTQPVARILSTDDYVKPTSYFYIGQTDKLITVGNPFFSVKKNGKELVPHVSANQYRSFRISLPDPNKFAFADPGFYDPNKHRLVWQLRALQIGRGGPLGVGTTGHPFFNKFGDTENPSIYARQTEDDRQNVSFDPKHTQLFVVGNKPCMGSYWGKAKACVGEDDHSDVTKCPPIELMTSEIQDGDMGDIGLGNMDFKELQEDNSGAPLEICTKQCKFPDFLQMQADPTGDHMWFFGKKESLYARHYFVRGGGIGEDVPHEPNDYFLSTGLEDSPPIGKMGPIAYFALPSGSLNSSDSQLFNRPFFLQKAQGQNNGVCWNNEFFVTVMDNSRNINFSINVSDEGPAESYKQSQFKQYLRHAEIYELSFILMVGRIDLDGSTLAHINSINSRVIEGWNLNFVPTSTNGLETFYRDIQSIATKCPADVPVENPDPYKNLSFWDIDMKEKLSLELDQFTLGRKFLSQYRRSSISSSIAGVKRPRSAKGKTVKRRKT
ncbi:L1 major capsid protein [Bos taurus papillomavirus 27]|uniref:Major capsid protein L1 n=2 Tax=Bovine papillomavirus TaxID=10571 RepID=A0A2Z4LI56_9PAPI|nr:L1 [Bovine papillomavirus]QYI89670.1 L1 major capsid protein [Bos taurus papillomavirus 27]QYI89676.1 L1 major capsid protein [Bos taurus papillomavirus 27]